MFKTRRKLYRLRYDVLIVFSIADCQENNPLKEPRALIATSRGIPAELGSIQAFLESPEKLPRAHYKVKILVMRNLPN